MSGNEKKKSTNNGGEQSKAQKDDSSSIPRVIVLKAELHCHGCAAKIIRCIRSSDGVEAVAMGDDQKITVVGKVDPAKLREAVERKTHKKVEIISPKPPKQNTDDKQNTKHKNESKHKNEKSDEQKAKEKKEPPVTTVSLKVHLHCDGCSERIHRTVTKTKGFHHMNIERQKNLVTVTGAMDMKALVESLRRQLKKDVEIVRKEGDKKNNSGKTAGGCSGGGTDKDGGEKKVDPYPYPYPYPYSFVNGSGTAGDPFQYNPYAVGSYQAPHMFSDENPNACNVM
ncbi:heavy metal-associated isoprenylated plant protein 3-like [Andrographis paniculata]|uniref:heavy metal-associated isoprenylated plant protein 3-like n=1 Tax=Andrographis paniculata TaxID=175694 RepID=UPI0021E932C0|nr:heavy metal-associated isoprenylated plant protein 3-like [Andrographis paniculata]